ncbi:MAG: DUF4007 family protein [Chthoniobacterales bacterium]|nr:DUF4007 family protein [Chthoniobacterales bacterium]
MAARHFSKSDINFRFSGHESFPLRYAWLPKAAFAIDGSEDAFVDEEKAMVDLGLGKNMVRALRFWVQAIGIAELVGQRLKVTDFGHAILLNESGDPYLEDVRTLWLLHWKLATHVNEPLFAWDYMLNRWQEPEIARSRVIRVFQFEAEAMGRKLSRVTMEQHFDVFIHTYIPTRGRKAEVQEDSLDCPLVQIALLEQVGERIPENSTKSEAIYAFRRDEKPEISPGLFCYCLNDFWNARHGNEKTISFKEVAMGYGSPGQIFKLPEADVRERLDAIASDSDSVFEFEESAASQTVIRRERPADVEMLRFIYDQQTIAV